MKSKSNVLSVRVSPWVKFLLHKISEKTGNPITFIFQEAVLYRAYKYSDISQRQIRAWLKEFREQGGEDQGKVE